MPGDKKDSLLNNLQSFPSFTLILLPCPYITGLKMTITLRKWGSNCSLNLIYIRKIKIKVVNNFLGGSRWLFFYIFLHMVQNFKHHLWRTSHIWKWSAPPSWVPSMWSLVKKRHHVSVTGRMWQHKKTHWYLAKNCLSVTEVTNGLNTSSSIVEIYRIHI